MDLFYAHTLTPDDQNYTLESAEAQHIVKVLRKKPGDLLQLTNGQGLSWTGVITAVFQKKIDLAYQTHSIKSPLPYTLHIAIAPTKSNDRIEWFLEKATEIGISKITPLLCDHSERKVIKPERWTKILTSALKQSQRYHLPVVEPLINFQDFVQQHQKQPLLIAHCHPGEKTPLKSISKQNTYTLLIGPEGDFSDREIDYIHQYGQAQAIDLGPARYRTETAGIVACLTLALKES